MNGADLQRGGGSGPPLLCNFQDVHDETYNHTIFQILSRDIFMCI